MKPALTLAIAALTFVPSCEQDHERLEAASAPAVAESAPLPPRSLEGVHGDFATPVEGIAFKYDQKTSSWASAKHAVPSNEKDVEAFLERLGTSLKSARLVPADATLIAGEEGVIRIERASRATAAPVRVPDPKDLGSPASVPDPRELGSPAARGGEPPKPKSNL